MTSFKSSETTREQVEELFTILSIMRPHQSKMESRFIVDFLAPLKPRMDDIGNLIVRVGDAPVLWSSHIDTVHRTGGIAPVQVDEFGIIRAHRESLANCLGADDGAGVWLMMQMIRAQRPGLYVFHRGEERGCIGSRWIAKNTPELLDGIQFAVAFDRRDNDSIITHQMGTRCCSEAFSASLSTAIGLDMKSDPTGSVTDTASYVDLVAECTNVSVGYKSQHGRTEQQDLPFLLQLHERMVNLDVRDLVVSRKPGDNEKRVYPTYNTNRGYYGGWGDCDLWDDEYRSWADGRTSHNSGTNSKTHDKSSGGQISARAAKKAAKKLDKSNRGKPSFRTKIDMDPNFSLRRRLVNGSTMEETMAGLVEDYPEEIAEMLIEQGFGVDYVYRQIKKLGAKIDIGYVIKSN